MSTATLNAPQTTHTPRRVSTPRSMVPKQADAAVSTPKDIDYHAVVAAIMLIKGKDGNGYGDRVVTRKGQQHVFALACNQIKSMLGIESKVDGQPVHLPEKPGQPYWHEVGEINHVVKVREAISSVLDREWNRFKAYGGEVGTSDIRWTWDKPKHTLIPAEKSEELDAAGNRLRDLRLQWKATAVAVRENKDIGEEILCAYRVKESAERQIANHDKKPGDYTREQKRAAIDLLHLAIWKIGRLEVRKAHLFRQATAIAVLDGQLSRAEVTPEAYAEAVKAIAAEPVPPQAVQGSAHGQGVTSLR